MEGFYFVYVLRSEKDDKKYTGYTQNLKLRLEQHQNDVESTKNRRPRFISLLMPDAIKREKFKDPLRENFLKKRLSFWFSKFE